VELSIVDVVVPARSKPSAGLRTTIAVGHLSRPNTVAVERDLAATCSVTRTGEPPVTRAPAH